MRRPVGGLLVRSRDRRRPASGARPVSSTSPLTSVLAVAALVLSTGAGFAVVEAAESIPAVLAIWIVGYAVAASALLDGVMRLRQVPRLPAALVLFVGLALASTAWSEAPPVTLRRSVALGGTVLVGLAIAQRLRPTDLLDAVRRAVLLVCLASLLLYAVGDPRALDDVHETLRGVLATKNTLGRVAAVGLVATACLAYLDRSARRRCAVAAVPMLLALGLTDSAGGWGVAVLGLATFGALALRRGVRSRYAPAVLAAGGLGAAVISVPAGFGPDDIAAAAGRDPTLTGRTDIWSESLVAASERPLTGHGFGAFWGMGGGGVQSDGAARIAARLAEPVAHAHNGLLDIALTLGLPGVVLAVLVLGALARRGVLDLRAGQPEAGALRLLVLGLLLASTAAESGLLQENALLTLLLVFGLSPVRSQAPVRGHARRQQPPLVMQEQRVAVPAASVQQETSSA